MELNKLQETIDKWIKENGVRYFSELTNTALLMEEVGEVARVMARKYGEQSFKENEQPDSLADELADVLFVLVCIANQTGINLTEAIQENLDKKSKRDKDRHLNNPKLKVKN
jgi:NTP pyrophosphatase (non-canonical NTP hydrolase)